ncbi:hypothetical protein VTK56DRAFT_8318 [Thermocarpiscus australiensis]
MPQLSEVSYSHKATVAAVSAYFDFLAKMYLNESDILRPPEGGWPKITPDRLKGLGKTDEVVLLLRHLPYLRDFPDNGLAIDASPSNTIRYNPTRKPILDDLYNYAPSEGKAEWRANPAWAVADFFELLKDHFRQLRTVPVSPSTVYDLENFHLHPKVAGAMPLVQALYREYGWPDLDRYCKEECLQAV